MKMFYFLKMLFLSYQEISQCRLLRDVLQFPILAPLLILITFASLKVAGSDSLKSSSQYGQCSLNDTWHLVKNLNYGTKKKFNTGHVSKNFDVGIIGETALVSHAKGKKHAACEKLATLKPSRICIVELVLLLKVIVQSLTHTHFCCILPRTGATGLALERCYINKLPYLQLNVLFELTWSGHKLQHAVSLEMPQGQLP